MREQFDASLKLASNCNNLEINILEKYFNTANLFNVQLRGA